MVRLTFTRILFAALSSSILLATPFIARLGRTRGYDILEARTSHDLATNGGKYGEACSPFTTGAMKEVTIVLKMGAAEVLTRLPSYLDEMGDCGQDILLFSDRQAEYKGKEIYDALANLRTQDRYTNSDFGIYDAIQQAGGSVEKTEDGWRLDKYKFLPMMELTRQLRSPKSKWFIFIELDTYVNWDNLYRFLTKFDPVMPHYFGSPVWPRKRSPFAHGGTGIVLSHSALDKLVSYGQTMTGAQPGVAGTHLFGRDMQKECCGDEVLAGVLRECGVHFHGYWPMFNGEKPSTIRFGPEQWCEAIITLHHLGDKDFDDLKQWELLHRQDPAEPLTLQELFTQHIRPQLRDRREDWTNMSEDVAYQGLPAGISFEACQTACERDSACLQFEHVGDTCSISYSIRLGHEDVGTSTRRSTSGWMLDRIQAFEAKHSPCDGAHMVHANP
jgi:hypothetical protein